MDFSAWEGWWGQLELCSPYSSLPMGCQAAAINNKKKSFSHIFKWTSQKILIFFVFFKVNLPAYHAAPDPDPDPDLTVDCYTI
ncbi:hypothetical protein QVD17_02604 [Tagetes erecta]|uniref:Uncharacterized protein n=1 Tax=Tagetes erecta TaxID=13708 RepID=A0AAD8L6Y2_TARER|nr:hypothetical protein QVD17_02604 [Tagetes erecta]